MCYNKNECFDERLINLIAYLKGNVEYIFNDYVVVEVNNIGYRVFVSAYTIGKIPPIHSEVKLYTYTAVKEDFIGLYGFLTMEELDMFNMLLTVSGIGPKVALAFLSAMTPSEISTAVAFEDIKSLSSVSGVGKKTAQRLILELKDKLKNFEMIRLAEDENNNIVVADGGTRYEAVEVLTALGYSQVEASRTVKAVYKDGMVTEEIVKLALKQLSKF